MKKSLLILAVSVLALSLTSSCRGNSGKDSQTVKKENVKTEYTCSMHPEVLSDKPGNCPKCGMALIEKK